MAVATRSPEPKVGHELGHGDGVHQHEVRLAEFQALLLRHGARSGGRAASGGRARAGAGAYGTLGRGRAGERRRALVSARAGSALDGRGRRLPLSRGDCGVCGGRGGETETAAAGPASSLGPAGPRPALAAQAPPPRGGSRPVAAQPPPHLGVAHARGGDALRAIRGG